MSTNNLFDRNKSESESDFSVEFLSESSSGITRKEYNYQMYEEYYGEPHPDLVDEHELDYTESSSYASVSKTESSYDNYD